MCSSRVHVYACVQESMYACRGIPCEQEQVCACGSMCVRVVGTHAHVTSGPCWLTPQLRLSSQPLVSLLWAETWHLHASVGMDMAVPEAHRLVESGGKGRAVAGVRGVVQADTWRGARSPGRTRVRCRQSRASEGQGLPEWTAGGDAGRAAGCPGGLGSRRELGCRKSRVHFTKHQGTSPPSHSGWGKLLSHSHWPPTLSSHPAQPAAPLRGERPGQTGGSGEAYQSGKGV